MKRRFAIGLMVIAFVCAGSIEAQEPAGEMRHPETSSRLDPYWGVDVGSPEGFRYVLVNWSRAIEETYGIAPTASTKFMEASAEDLQVWMTYMDDPEEFARVVGRIVSGLGQNQTLAMEHPDLEDDLETTSLPLTPGLTGPFTPDYPPAGGDYGTVVVGGINAFGIAATNQQRCNATQWDDFLAAWYIIFKTLSGLDGACVVAGCDPIGIVCAAVCAPLEIAAAGLEVAAVPVDLCDIHAASVDSAEIEAAFENSVTLLSNLSHVHDDLAAHDTNIDGDLAAHDTNIDGDLVAHDTNIDGDLAAHDTNIDNDLAAHDTNIDTDLAAHDANIDTDLAAHDTNIDGDLQTHDANIDGDLQTHDTDIKALLDNLQGTIDDELELRRVHLQVVEISDRKTYMVSATEGGNPVAVDFLAIETFDFDAAAFMTLGAAVPTEIEAGIYLVDLNLSPADPDTLFRFHVRHDDVVDHFGHAVFRRTKGNLVSGQ